MSDLLKSLCHQLDGLLQSPGFCPDSSEVRETVLEPLKQALQNSAQDGYMALAQINPSPGDLAGNAQKIIRYMACAETIGVDAIIFPELALMGYPIRDVISRHPFLADENIRWLKALAQKSGRTRVILGFVEPRHPPRYPEEEQQLLGKPFYNTLAVLGDGQILGLVRKSLLPTYNEFEDDRTFEASPVSGIQDPDTLCKANWEASATNNTLYTLQNNKTIGFSICEDTWNNAAFFKRGSLYSRDPIWELAAQKPDLLINISASPTRSRKEQLKHNMLSHIAQQYAVPYVYVNQTGSVDEINFDGASRAYNAQGQLLARAKSFGEQFMIINPFTQQGWIEELPTGLEKTLAAQKFFDAYDDTDMGRTYEALLQGIRDYFLKTGFTRATLGISGGLDSAVVATLLADALGPENIIALSMPSDITPAENRKDAQTLCKNLGITLVETPISNTVLALDNAFNTLHPELENKFGKRLASSNANDNAQAITRATLLRQVGNDYNALPIATSDKSELYLGYATVNGDMSGALAPLGDVPKTKVRALFRWMNKHRQNKDVLPLSIVEKPSGADLKLDPETQKPLTAEADLMPYEFADEIIWRIEALKQNFNEILNAPFQ